MDLEVYGIPFLTGVALTFIVLQVGHLIKAHAPIDFRRRSRATIPLLGGSGIYLATVISNLYFQNHLLFKLLIVVIPLIIVGIWDDMKELRARNKMVIQLLSAVLWFYWVQKANVPLFSFLPEGISLLLTIFWIVTMCNAVNFIDGVDGQASMFAISALLALSYGFGTLQRPGVMLAMATAGFLFWNYPRAKIYLGEVGSSTLGFTIAVLSLSPNPQTSPLATAVGILFICAFPLADISVAVLRRVVKRRSPFQADRDHLHHKMQRIGLSSTKTSAVSGFVSVLASATGVQLIVPSSSDTPVVLAVLMTAALLFILGSVFYVERLLASKTSQIGRPILKKVIKTSKWIEFNRRNHKALLIDLLPHYGELQSQGFMRVSEFASDVGEMVHKLFPTGQIAILGYYSILILINNEKEWDLKEQEDIASAYYTILGKYQIIKAQTLKPEGVYYYTSKSAAHVKHLLEDLLIPVVEVNNAVTQRSA